MPLYLEAQIGSQWTEVGAVRPGDRPGSISDNKDDGTRTVYLLECAEDDSKSTISKPDKLGVDATADETRIIECIGVEIVKVLEQGSPPFELRVKWDGAKESRSLRFSHKKAS